MNRRLVLRSAWAGLVVLSSVLVAAAAPTASLQAGAGTWASALDPGEKVQYLDRAALLPREYTRALMASFRSPQERSEAWRHIFESFRRSHSLTTDQDAAVSEAVGRLEVGLFETPLTEAATVEFARIRLQLTEVLGGRLAMDLFEPSGRADIGLPTRERWLRWVRIQRSKRTGLIAALDKLAPMLLADELLNCDCARNLPGWNPDDDCHYEQHCELEKPQSEICNYMTWGCGPFPWLADCDSKCGYGLPGGG